MGSLQHSLKRLLCQRPGAESACEPLRSEVLAQRTWASLRLHGGGPTSAAALPARLVLFTGEGAHSAQTNTSNLWSSPGSLALDAALWRMLGHRLESFLAIHLGEHAAPHSALVTTIINLLNADRWHAVGLTPRLALGHSIGEVAAAQVAGLLSVDGALATARALGLVGSQCTGAMVHARLTHDEVAAWSDELLCIAAVSGVASSGALLNVTLCGPTERTETWLARRPDANRPMPPYPWHHPTYLSVLSVRDGGAFAGLPDGSAKPGLTATTVLSATHSGPVKRLDPAHWREWLTTHVDFKGALECAAALLPNAGCFTIETGAHNILTPVAAATLSSCGARVIGSAASMRRGQPQGFWEAQRSQLEARLHAMEETVYAIATRLRSLLARSLDVEELSAEAALVNADVNADAGTGMDTDATKVRG